MRCPKAKLTRVGAIIDRPYTRKYCAVVNERLPLRGSSREAGERGGKALSVSLREPPLPLGEAYISFSWTGEHSSPLHARNVMRRKSVDRRGRRSLQRLVSPWNTSSVTLRVPPSPTGEGYQIFRQRQQIAEMCHPFMRLRTKLKRSANQSLLLWEKGDRDSGG